MIGVGAWAKVQFGDYVELSQKVDYVTGTSLLIAIGVIIAIVAFFGCCGAWKENKCMLIIVRYERCSFEIKSLIK